MKPGDLSAVYQHLRREALRVEHEHEELEDVRFTLTSSPYRDKAITCCAFIVDSEKLVYGEGQTPQAALDHLLKQVSHEDAN